jgi:addiction module HigA family antidote
MNSELAGLPLVHPGDVLREDVIPDCRLSKTAFAQRLGISREALHNILGRKSAVTPLMAHKLARLLGTSPEVWMNLQQAYDLAVVAAEKRAELDRIEALAA